MNNKAPSYLKSLITSYEPSRTLRSSAKNLLVVPKVRTKTFGQRSFSYCAPQIWNSLPQKLREAGNESNFKSDLKTHLFKTYLL